MTQRGPDPHAETTGLQGAAQPALLSCHLPGWKLADTSTTHSTCKCPWARVTVSAGKKLRTLSEGTRMAHTPAVRWLPVGTAPTWPSDRP